MPPRLILVVSHFLASSASLRNTNLVRLQMTTNAMDAALILMESSGKPSASRKSNALLRVRSRGKDVYSMLCAVRVLVAPQPAIPARQPLFNNKRLNL